MPRMNKNTKLYHILVIDDDTRLRNLLARFLDENGFYVSVAKDTLEAKKLMSEFLFDLLIVDVMMPDQDGIDFTTKFRKESKIPVIMLTARGDFEDRIKGLESGADDYLPKPFEPKELLLRINNILRRIAGANNEQERICHFGDFSFNLANSRLKKGDQYVHLTEGEAKILTILCKEQSVVVSREKIRAIGGDVDERSIDVQITRLRKKIETNPKQPHYLQTIRNCGYVLYT
jgi:two-component system phosphate regulon response regulator OmpR